jgi:hypothetical protein
MTREEKCKLFEAKGFKYDSETGEIRSHKENPVIRKRRGYITLGLRKEDKSGIVNLAGQIFSWWMFHREILPDHLVIDHEDRDKTNNRISNLKINTKEGNAINSNSWENSRGYTFHKPTGKWQAKIRLDNKAKHLGLFPTEKEAREAYLTALAYYYPDRYKILEEKDLL